MSVTASNRSTSKAAVLEIAVSPNEDLIKQALNELAHIEAGAPKAMSAALNKTATGAKTEIKKAVATRYFVKQADVAATLSVHKASPGDLRIRIVSAGAGIPLSKFKLSPSAPLSQKGVPVSSRGNVHVTIKRGTSGSDVAEKIGGKLMKGFVARMSSNHVGVFVRNVGKGQKRASRNVLPIKQLVSPAIPNLINASLQVITPKIQARMDKNLEQAITAVEKGFIK